MAISISPALAETIARAYTTGVETSFQALSEILLLDKDSKLEAAVKIIEVVSQLQLELIPGPDRGEFDTVRVLRAGSSSTDSVDRLRQLMQRGEDPFLEFKSSMLCSMREWTTTGNRIELPSLEGEVLKTVGAFLNADGGDLVVGVDDAGAACEGINLDLALRGWNLDKWQLHFHSLVSSRFYDGGQIQPYLRASMLQVDALPVFHVAVMPRQKRSFLRRDKSKAFEFFVRNGPRTESLDFPTFYAHMLATAEAPYQNDLL